MRSISIVYLNSWGRSVTTALLKMSSSSWTRLCLLTEGLSVATWVIAECIVL